MSRKIACEIRCQEAATVCAAKAAMKGAAVGKMPFVCKVSGKTQEILLISDDAAERLATLIPTIGGPLAQKIAAAILRAGLCECDIATLTECDEGQVLEELERLRSTGVAQCREIDGMNYYALVSTAVRDLLRRHISDLEAA